MTTTQSPHVVLVNQIIEQGRISGILHKTIENHSTNRKHILLNGKKVQHFGNCSYLGIEHDDRLKEAATEAIHRYGIQFECSRTYVKLPLYLELEDLLTQIFRNPTIAAPATTLAHLSVIPVLINRQDAVILDQQAHTSMQLAVSIAKSNGTHVEVVKHNNMDMLHSRLEKLTPNHERIWYLADGVYSMYGDVAPLSTLTKFMSEFDNFHTYIDDAHGMSWTGENGQGYSLSQMPKLPEKMILLTSLSKGFGGSGAAIITANEDWQKTIQNVGPTLMFSSPIPPASLAANIASAKIHLSTEINQKQEKLAKLISYFKLTAKAFHLPLAEKHTQTPIFFIGVGTPTNGAEICRRLLDSGFLLSPSAYPSVPQNKTGMRVNLTVNQTENDIYEMLSCFAEHLADMEAQNKLSLETIHKAIGSPLNQF